MAQTQPQRGVEVLGRATTAHLGRPHSGKESTVVRPVLILISADHAPIACALEQAEAMRMCPDMNDIVRRTSSIAQLAATLSHELRTPLNAIVGSVVLLERQVPHASRQKVHIDRIKRNSSHLVAILDDIRALLSDDDRDLRVLPAVQRLRPVVAEALADVELNAAANGVAILNTVPGVNVDLCYWGDDRRVRQILVNLLTNAIKFTAPGGHITLSAGTAAAPWTTSNEMWTFVCVEDTGRGIPAVHVANVFEPLRQIEPTDKLRGQGLGLAISRQFARRMGGEITLQSEVGVGSRFALWLPMNCPPQVR